MSEIARPCTSLRNNEVSFNEVLSGKLAARAIKPTARFPVALRRRSADVAQDHTKFKLKLHEEDLQDFEQHEVHFVFPIIVERENEKID